MSLKITVTGAPNTGKTTAARLIQLALEEAGYADVHVADKPPVREGKGEFQARWQKNKRERVEIVVEVAAEMPRRVCMAVGGDRVGHRCHRCSPVCGLCAQAEGHEPNCPCAGRPAR